MAFLNDIKKRVSSVASVMSEVADKKIKDISSVTEDVKKKAMEAASDISEVADKKIKDISSVTEDVKKKAMETASDVSETWENREKYYTDLKDWTADIPHTIKEYADNFNIEDFWNKIKDSALKAGQDVVFMALTCYYAIEDKFVSKKKNEK